MQAPACDERACEMHRNPQTDVNPHRDISGKSEKNWPTRLTDWACSYKPTDEAQAKTHILRYFQDILEKMRESAVLQKKIAILYLADESADET